MNKFTLIALIALVAINSKFANADEHEENVLRFTETNRWEACQKGDLVCTKAFLVNGDYFHCCDKDKRLAGCSGNTCESSYL